MKKLIYVISLVLIYGVASAGPMKKLLIVDSQNGEPYESARVAMIEELESQGFVPGKTIEINRFNAQNKTGRAKRILMNEAPKGYDVMFINGTTANISAHEFGFNNPKFTFVFCSITDPVGVGLVDKLNAPTNSNFTGVAYPVSVEERLRFLKEVLPEAKKIGYIYADMAQSHSYLKWLKDAVKKDEFSDLEIIDRKVEFVSGDNGDQRMSRIQKNFVQELDPVVDVFMTPSDQLGTRKVFAQIVSENSNKPLMGLTEKEIKEDWGAHFALYMVQRLSGQEAGRMIARLLSGEPITTIIPTNPSGEYAINMKRAKTIGLTFPESVIKKASNNIIH